MRIIYLWVTIFCKGVKNVGNVFAKKSLKMYIFVTNFCGTCQKGSYKYSKIKLQGNMGIFGIYNVKSLGNL